MEITGDHYRIAYDADTSTITCEGSLRLYGANGFLTISAFEHNRITSTLRDAGRSSSQTGYASIIELLFDVIEQQPAQITLDLRRLESMNSSGINVFSKFIIKVRQAQEVHLHICGNASYTWQQKVLRNFQKLLPALSLEWEADQPAAP